MERNSLAGQRLAAAGFDRVTPCKHLTQTEFTFLFKFHSIYLIQSPDLGQIDYSLSVQWISINNILPNNSNQQMMIINNFRMINYLTEVGVVVGWFSAAKRQTLSKWAKIRRTLIYLPVISQKLSPFLRVHKYELKSISLLDENCNLLFSTAP